jgi:hypothetical protein
MAQELKVVAIPPSEVGVVVNYRPAFRLMSTILVHLVLLPGARAHWREIRTIRLRKSIIPSIGRFLDHLTVLFHI